MLAPLAVLGVWATWDRRQALLPLYPMLLAYLASVVFFYVFGRYRYPAVAILALFAGAAVVEAPRFLLAASVRTRVACGLSVATAIAVCNWPTDAEARVRSATLYNLGALLAGQPARAGEAIAFYEESLSLRPDSVGTLYNLGNLLRRQGDLRGAEDRY